MALQEFLTNENINYMWQRDVIRSISDKEIGDLLINLNTHLVDKIIEAADNKLYLTKDGKGNDEEVLSYCNKLNGNSTYSDSSLLKALKEIRKKEKTPFVLGLICKVPLIEGYKFISESDTSI
jgi:hypothetical protein